MKRWMVRLSAVSAIVLFGLLLFAHAYRGEKPAATDSAETAEAGDQDATPKPIPLVGESETMQSSNPFNSSSRLIAQAEETPSAAPPADNRYAQVEHREALSNDTATEEPRRLQAPADARALSGNRNPFGKRGAQVSDEGSFVERTANTTADAIVSDEATSASADSGDEAAGPAEQLTSEPAEEQTEKAASRYSDRYRTKPAVARIEPEIEEPAAAASPVRIAGRSRFGDSADSGPNDDSAFAPPAGRQTRPNGAAGSGRPGARELEGSQAPSLVIEKTAPPEIQVGKPATFVIRVRNAGQVPAQGVEIHDEVPQGAELAGTKPTAINNGSKLVWQLGTLKPGDETTVQMQITPQVEGEMGSVASVTFQAHASVRTVATRPQLKIDLSAPAKVMIGQEAALKIRVSNPGTGPATGVVLTEEVPPGFKHPGGEELELEIGTLKPGESRDLELTLSAMQPGPVTNVLRAVGDAGLTAEDRDQIEVIAPALKLAMQGPKRRYLQRNATYQVSVKNPGTAAAKDIELTTVLPRGLQFVDANNAGHYDPTSHSVVWSLEELPPGETGTVTFTTMAIEAGDLKLSIKGVGKQGLTDSLDETVVVEGVAAIFFELVDVADPIEVGGETTYEIRVINQGSAAATNVRLVAVLPAEMKALDADGPVRHTIDGQRVLFDPLNQLAPKADTMYTVKVQGEAPGDLRLRVQIVTDQITNPVTKEESTRVYADE